MKPAAHSFIEIVGVGALFVGGVVGLIVLGLWLYGRFKSEDSV